MKHALVIALLGLVAAAEHSCGVGAPPQGTPPQGAPPQVVVAGEPSPPVVTTGTLLGEMTDLGRLARWPTPAYHTVQFSSFDRRSTTPEAPGWFSNADGFGGEPIPGFIQVLRRPGEGQAGLYLLAEVQGPGAIVRGWSAGMGGLLRVYLDPDTDAANATAGAPSRVRNPQSRIRRPQSESPNPKSLVWEGPAYDFLARRSAHFLRTAGIELDAGDAFSQQDADYLPMPFARGLRVTWEGKLDELHFYHLQVRRYTVGTAVRTFDPRKDLKESGARLRAAVAALTKPSSPSEGVATKLEGEIEPGRRWSWSSEQRGPGAIRELRLRLRAERLDEALRGCLLRIAFDGSQRPQVEAPLGDFFASGPGVNPFSSLPFSVEADGTMSCRFVMPYREKARLEVVNFTPSTVHLDGRIFIAPWKWDDTSMYFRAKWRTDPDLLAGVEPIDLPYLVAIGRGVFVGCAAMIVNPSGAPMAYGNWWGEGDEKILVDGNPVPAIFGTGSEDYFNYSWSRPDLFDHPYCGQPLDSGPDTSGYISNHRFQVLDAVPFERSLAALLELWAHNRTPGLSYARITYHYARPDAIDDHRGLMPSDLTIKPLPKREFQAVGAAAGARCFHFDELRPEVTSGRLETVPFPLATQLKIASWRAEKGGRLKFSLPVDKDRRASLHLIAVHRTDGATVRVLLDGKPLVTQDGAEEIRLRSAHASRVLNVHFRPVELKAGAREIVLECAQSGAVGLDSIWVKEE
jgi:hypothetical protein